VGKLHVVLVIYPNGKKAMLLNHIYGLTRAAIDAKRI